MQKALERLKSMAEESKTILCFGIDPAIEKISCAGGICRPGNAEQQIVSYYSEIIDALLEENQISAIKPNYAYFAQYGFEGLKALKSIISNYKNKTFIIFDGKRGDIGKSSDAYANEVYGFWGADAVTLSPYMGSDSVKPFLKNDKIAYVLCRTSNEGAKDFQELKIGKEFLYEKVAKAAAKWQTGLVVGATSDAIKKITKITKNKTPLLIPGVGAQGGDLDMVLKSIKTNISIHRINASSSIAYAYEKYKLSARESALKEAEKINETIRHYF